MNRLSVLPILLILFGIAGVQVSAESALLPEVQLPLAPPASSTPYDDEEFLEKANATISELCTGETLPVGSKNRAFQDELTSTYYSLIRMNISEDQYPQAKKITTFLSYTLTLVEQYEDYEKEKEKMTPVDMGITSYEDLEEWYDAASGVWKNLSPGYPDAEMYRMPSLIERKDWTVGQFPVV
jgi:hypothetical protein